MRTFQQAMQYYIVNLLNKKIKAIYDWIEDTFYCHDMEIDETCEAATIKHTDCKLDPECEIRPCMKCYDNLREDWEEFKDGCENY